MSSKLKTESLSYCITINYNYENFLLLQILFHCLGESKPPIRCRDVLQALTLLVVWLFLLYYFNLHVPGSFCYMPTYTSSTHAGPLSQMCSSWRALHKVLICLRFCFLHCTLRSLTSQTYKLAEV